MCRGPRSSRSAQRLRAVARRRATRRATLPGGMPPIIGETAAEVTAGAENDYDRLVDAAAVVPQQRRIHVLARRARRGAVRRQRRAGRRAGSSRCARATACTSRRRSPSWRGRSGCRPASSSATFRAPRPPTRSRAERSTRSSSSQLHAWPEVYFEGIGWIAFEPTVGPRGCRRRSRRPRRSPTTPAERVDVDAGAVRLGLGPRPRADEDIADQGVDGRRRRIGERQSAADASASCSAVLRGARDPRARAGAAHTTARSRAARRGDTVGRVDGGAGCRDRSRHPGPGERVSARARSSSDPRSRRAARGDDAARERHRTRELRPGRQGRRGRRRWRMPRPPSAPRFSPTCPRRRRARAVLVPRSLVVRPGSRLRRGGRRRDDRPLTDGDRGPVRRLAAAGRMSFGPPGPRRIRLVAYGARLESVLGESPRGFESPILRPCDPSVFKGSRLI